ncbi:MAG: hypothetical protein PF541_05020 [Prolixibacteraceae bacterium]|jgi:hypothetical protein|nr:hypothetical protein [Prolixibacteraceae bacterium]
MKTQFLLPITLSVLLFSFGFTEMNSSEKLNNELSRSFNSFNFNSEIELEDDLNIENWMTDDACWEIEAEVSIYSFRNDVFEECLVIETWMTDDVLWNL